MGLWRVNGSVDYVVATYPQHSLKERMHELEYGTAKIMGLYLTIVEAKRDETFGAGKGQTAVEMKVIWEFNQVMLL